MSLFQGSDALPILMQRHTRVNDKETTTTSKNPTILIILREEDRMLRAAAAFHLAFCLRAEPSSFARLRRPAA